MRFHAKQICISADLGYSFMFTFKGPFLRLHVANKQEQCKDHVVAIVSGKYDTAMQHEILLCSMKIFGVSNKKLCAIFLEGNSQGHTHKFLLCTRNTALCITSQGFRLLNASLKFFKSIMPLRCKLRFLTVSTSLKGAF